MQDGFYKVRVCPHCDVVFSCYRPRSPGSSSMSWYDEEPSVRINEICQVCGADVPWEKLKETTARWVWIAAWWLPWTWGAGKWILREHMAPEDVAKLINASRK